MHHHWSLAPSPLGSPQLVRSTCITSACTPAAGDKAKALQASIDELAKKYGGTKVNAHLTLMAGIVDDRDGAEDRAKLLSSQVKVTFCQFR